MIKGPFGFLKGSSSTHITILPTLVATGIVVLVCYLISQDHVIKGSSNIMDRSPSRLVMILSNFVLIGIVVVDI